MTQTIENQLIDELFFRLIFERLSKASYLKVSRFDNEGNANLNYFFVEFTLSDRGAAKIVRRMPFFYKELLTYYGPTSFVEEVSKMDFPAMPDEDFFKYLQSWHPCTEIK